MAPSKLAWARREPFNPLSRDQVLSYGTYKKYPIPKNRKTKKPTVDDEALEKLSIRFPEDTIISGVRLCRAVSKARGYLKGTYLGRDDRLHPQYINLPETGRLSSKAPNIQNQPQGRDQAKAELAKEVRNTVVATPGFRLGETDWRAIEALLVGYFGEDPAYMRLARLGVHDFLSCHVIIKQPTQWAILKELGPPPVREELSLEEYVYLIGEYEAYSEKLALVVEWFKAEPPSLDMEDTKLKDYFRKVKKLFPKVRYSCKTVVHGSNYLAGIPTIARNLECSYKEAETLVAIYRDALPGIKAYQTKTLQMAHGERRMTCPFGCPSPYWFQVGEPLPDGTWKMGKQANEAAAWRPQHTCSCLLREVLVLLDELDGDDFHLLAPIHDSIFWEAREEKFDFYKKEVESRMERAWPELGGLAVETETKSGMRWSQME